MNKYKRLILNTLLFGVASFSSKFLSIFITMVLTRVFSKDQVGSGQLVIDTCNFIVPVISLCVHEAVIRFGLENSQKKSDVFTTAVLTILAGYLLLLVCWPALRLIPYVQGYLLAVYVYVLTSALRSTVTHFVRASGFVRIFALDGLVTTLSTVLFTVLFILQFQWGVSGYVWAIIAADAVSAVGLILILKLYRFFKPGRFSKTVLRQMLSYSIPLVPTAIFWWITNLSDRYLVTGMVSGAANGLYTVSYKIPTMITLVSAIFIQAWQISAFSEYDSKESVQFYSSVFSGYHTLVFVAASGLILLVKPLTTLLWGNEFIDAWRYSPFLVLATAFSCLVTFLGTIYNAAKSNRMVTITTFIGAVANLGMNLVLIPKYGPNGAAFATFFSYFVVFVIRLVDTRRYMALHIQPLRIAASLVVLLIQVWACLSQVKYWAALEVAIVILLILCNLGPILFVASNLLGKLKKRRTAG